MSMRLSYMLTAFALITPALMMSNTQDAEACSIAHFEESMPPEWSETNEFPANGIFYAEFEQRYHWVDEQGDPIELEEVMELNLPELLDIRRPVTPLTPGQKIMTEGCNHESCTWTIVEEDTTAPPTPRISEVEVYIDRQRRLAPHGGCKASPRRATPAVPRRRSARRLRAGAERGPPSQEG